MNRETLLDHVRKAAVFAAVALCAAAGLAHASMGLAPAAPGPLGAASTLSAASSSELPPGYVRDVIPGNRSRGPYLLSWRGIPANRESVIIDGRRALRGVDYQLDPVKGQIAFSSPLSLSSLAMVEYPLDPATSVRNDIGFTVPLELDLYSSGNSSLKLTTVYTQKGVADAARGEALLGLSGSAVLSPNTRVETSLLVRPDSSGGGSRLEDRAGGRIGVTTVLAPGLSVSGAYATAGHQMAAGKERGLAAGRSSQDLALAWKPEGGRLTLDSVYQKIDADGRVGGGGVTTLRHSLGYALSGNAQLAYTRLDTEKSSGGSSSRSITDTLQLSGKLGDRTAAKFVWTGAQSSGSELRTQHLTLNTAILTGVAVNASYLVSGSSKDGEARALDVGVAAAPAKNIEVKAAFSERDSALTGTDTSGSLRVAARPAERLRVSAGIADRQAGQTGIRSRDLRIESQPLSFLSLSGGYTFSGSGDTSVIVRDISATARPLGFATVEGVFKNRDSSSSEVNTSALALSVTPVSFLGITASLSQNPEDSKGNVQFYDARSVGLKANIGILSLTGGYASRDEYLAGREWWETRLGLGVRLAHATHLTGGYELSETEAAHGLSSRRLSLGLRRDLGSDFNLLLSGSRTDVEQSNMPGTDRRYEAEIRLGVRF
jgi:hypothetical protein